jgi:activator of 2-hydroxyglutaryl-CoA dehydratase
MYIGIDLGTSGVKAILLNEQGEVVALPKSSTCRVRTLYGLNKILSTGGWRRTAR